MSLVKNAAKVGMGAKLIARPGVGASVGHHHLWHFECRDKDGKLKWEETAKNLVPTAGLTDILDVYWKVGTQAATWYVGLLLDETQIAAGDTAVTHTWTEFTDYTGSRKALVLGAITSGAADNSASVAAFTATGAGTVGGGFLQSAATGTTGVLSAAVAFDSPGDRTLATDDVLNVTVTITHTSV